MFDWLFFIGRESPDDVNTEFGAFVWILTAVVVVGVVFAAAYWVHLHLVHHI